MMSFQRFFKRNTSRFLPCLASLSALLFPHSSLNAADLDTVPTVQKAQEAKLQDPVFQEILKIYRKDSGIDWAKNMAKLLDQEVVLLSWDGQQTVPLRGNEKVKAYLENETQKLPLLKKEVGRFMVAGGGVGGARDPHHSVLVLFYQGSAQEKEKQPWVWAGCDLITIANGKIVDWRIQEDTHMKLVTHPQKIAISNEYSIIDKFWSPQTSTNNLVGMSYLLDLKRTVMPTNQRGELLLKRFMPIVEQSTWEPDGILLLKGIDSIKKLFFDSLQTVLPDFYENVERTLVSGNAFIMVQNPSGTETRKDGSKNHRAWYNCDIYFFDGPNISAMLFQRDTQMDIVEENKK